MTMKERESLVRKPRRARTAGNGEGFPPFLELGVKYIHSAKQRQGIFLSACVCGPNNTKRAEMGQRRSWD